MKKQAAEMFINWEVTESYSGDLTGIGKIDTEKGENYFLEFQDGKRVGISATIKRAIKYAKANDIGFAIGCKMDFVFEGTKQTKSGNNLNLIRVSINDKEIRPEMIEDFEGFIDTLSEL